MRALLSAFLLTTLGMAPGGQPAIDAPTTLMIGPVRQCGAVRVAVSYGGFEKPPVLNANTEAPGVAFEDLRAEGGLFSFTLVYTAAAPNVFALDVTAHAGTRPSVGREVFANEGIEVVRR